MLFGANNDQLAWKAVEYEELDAMHASICVFEGEDVGLDYFYLLVTSTSFNLRSTAVS